MKTSLSRRLGLFAVCLAAIFSLGCEGSAPVDPNPIPPGIDTTPKSSDEAAAEQMKTSAKKP